MVRHKTYRVHGGQSKANLSPVFRGWGTMDSDLEVHDSFTQNEPPLKY